MADQKLRRIITTTKRGGLMHSSVIEEDTPGGRMYFAEVWLNGKLTDREGPFFDQDEAEQRADVMREKVFTELHRGNENKFDRKLR